MPRLADVLRQYAPEYLERFGQETTPEQRGVLRAIMSCRTGDLGTVFYACPSCGATHVMGRGCGNRHCASCQADKARAWLERQTERLLPCPYFLITFTLPESLREFARRHPRQVYTALFDESAASLKKLAADAKYVGTKRPGFFGVLHTWGRALVYHPHVHYVVPGGGLSHDGHQWLASRADFFVPVRALSKIFRAKFRDAIERAGLLHEIDPAVWRQDWVVHSKAVGDGRASLKYLAPYVFRVAISDRRIVSCDGGKVVFAVKQSGSTRYRPMTLDAMEFIRRLLWHVLPRGFMKVRHYGFLSSNPGVAGGIEAVRWLVSLHYELEFWLKSSVLIVTAARPRVRCPKCGGPMLLIGFVPPEFRPIERPREVALAGCITAFGFHFRRPARCGRCCGERMDSRDGSGCDR